MTPAPALDCTLCGRTIGKRRGHVLTEDRKVLCSRCSEDRASHAQLYPECPHGWHDVYDHPLSTGTRAGIAAFLGMWP